MYLNNALSVCLFSELMSLHSINDLEHVKYFIYDLLIVYMSTLNSENYHQKILAFSEISF